jgi:hypothetical protein
MFCEVARRSGAMLDLVRILMFVFGVIMQVTRKPHGMAVLGS